VAKIKLNKFGWRRDKPDKRDIRYMMPQHFSAHTLPPSVDLRGDMPEVYNQLDLGSCTGQAIAADIHYQLVRQHAPVWKPSPLFIYYNERMIEGTVSVDSGAELRDGMKAINRWGVCHEDLCPYDVTKFRNKPSRQAFRAAAKHKIIDYRRVPQTLLSMKSVLAEKDPFVFGFTVYEGFDGDEIAKTGMMTIPRPNEVVLGGHAVLAVGYDDHRQVFIIRNSWGTAWGDKGYFYMPYSYITDDDYAADFWTVRWVPNV
jgi:C1A family cysteine protease